MSKVYFVYGNSLFVTTTEDKRSGGITENITRTDKIDHKNMILRFNLEILMEKKNEQTAKEIEKEMNEYTENFTNKELIIKSLGQSDKGDRFFIVVGYAEEFETDYGFVFECEGDTIKRQHKPMKARSIQVSDKQFATINNDGSLTCCEYRKIHKQDLFSIDIVPEAPYVVLKIACGANHIMFKVDDKWYGKGSNVFNQIPHVKKEKVMFLSYPKHIKELDDIYNTKESKSLFETQYDVYCGGDNTTVVKKSGPIFSPMLHEQSSISFFGSNENYQLGDENKKKTLTTFGSKEFPFIKDYLDKKGTISMGPHHTLFFTESNIQSIGYTKPKETILYELARFEKTSSILLVSVIGHLSYYIVYHSKNNEFDQYIYNMETTQIHKSNIDKQLSMVNVKSIGSVRFINSNSITTTLSMASLSNPEKFIGELSQRLDNLLITETPESESSLSEKPKPIKKQPKPPKATTSSQKSHSQARNTNKNLSANRTTKTHKINFVEKERLEKIFENN
jgi:hypothetical protein